MQTFTGYMAHAEWDGVTLKLIGHNKASKVAIAGDGWESDALVTPDGILSLESKTPSRMVNGWVKIRTTDGRKLQMNFRHKQAEDLAALVSAVGGERTASPQEPATTAAPPPPPPSVPAGWYPDPNGQPLQRYWDGTQWTEHTAPQA
jgi:hypothetical protein